jgi:hypothetical protein
MTFVVASEQARVIANELFILVQLAERCTDSLLGPLNNREPNPVLGPGTGMHTPGARLKSFILLECGNLGYLLEIEHSGPVKAFKRERCTVFCGSNTRVQTVFHSVIVCITT